MGEARSWTFRELAEAGQLEYGDGYRTKKAEIGATGYPILRVAEVLDGRIAPSFTEFVRPEFRSAMKGKVSQPGDVVLTTKGTVGRVAIMPADEGEFVYSPQVCYFRVAGGSSLDARFLYYWFRSVEFRRQAVGLKGQTDMADYLNLSDIGALRIAPPPCREQRAIVEVLGALDDKIALNEQTCATSLELADCYSQVVNQAGDEGTVATLAQLAAEGQLEFGDGYRTKRAEHGKPGLPILRVAEIADGEIRPAFADYVSDDYRPAMGRKTSRPGDVVLTTKGTVGRVALISADHPEFVYSPQVCYFRPVDKFRLSSVYLFHWMRGPEFWRQAAGMKGQTDMADYLSLGDIKSLRITLPSQAALAEFNRKCAPLHAQAAAVRNENRTLADLRDTLLPQLLSGKLRVKDAVRTVEEVV
ncbi:restriction endonuclease subunit S [Streptomyces sp. NRRL WC-3725]|uniref:restriction endonuclease subunit S n=1 Tax=Streptomyces sp. NRRL WC-3725 TaxID=1463933 RepID=UPI0004CBECBA|nr:restriction endonuclease subunit S [Streptomyces sp. NRRL WC-3725]